MKTVNHKKHKNKEGTIGNDKTRKKNQRTPANETDTKPKTYKMENCAKQALELLKQKDAMIITTNGNNNTVQINKLATWTQMHTTFTTQQWKNENLERQNVKTDKLEHIERITTNMQMRNTEMRNSEINKRTQ